MPHLRLSFFGTFTVSIDNHSIIFATDKARALLVYLALEASQPHSRTSLTGLLWPEIPSKQARNNLRQTLHRLRQTFDKISPGLSQRLFDITHQSVQFIVS